MRSKHFGASIQIHFLVLWCKVLTLCPTSDNLGSFLCSVLPSCIGRLIVFESQSRYIQQQYCYFPSILIFYFWSSSSSIYEFDWGRQGRCPRSGACCPSPKEAALSSLGFCTSRCFFCILHSVRGATRLGLSVISYMCCFFLTYTELTFLIRKISFQNLFM